MATESRRSTDPNDFLRAYELVSELFVGDLVDDAAANGDSALTFGIGPAGVNLNAIEQAEATDESSPVAGPAGFALLDTLGIVVGDDADAPGVQVYFLLGPNAPVPGRCVYRPDEDGAR